VVVNKPSHPPHSHKNNQEQISSSYSLPDHQNLSSLTLAEKELKRWKKWVQDFAKQNDKIMEELGTLASLANGKPGALHGVDVEDLRRAWGRGKARTEKVCGSCKKKDELIEIIREEYGVKLEECKKY
jgi:hypothetical protein